MFEAEMEMEKKSSSWLALVLIVALGAAVLAVVGYFIYQSKAGKLTPDQAATILSDSLKARTAVLQFHTGTVVPSVNDKPTDPHYRLLEKAGILKLANGKGQAKVITLTAAGEKLLTAFPEFKPEKEDDGTLLYAVPLGRRKLVAVTSVTMNGLSAATVAYTWQWEPSQLGDIFDADSDGFKKMAVWDRQTLIDKYGADYYHAGPNRATINFLKGDKGWQIAP